AIPDYIYVLFPGSLQKTGRKTESELVGTTSVLQKIVEL
ncbi:unnamed protein product, partial [Cercopithifilaria johnstoni]